MIFAVSILSGLLILDKYAVGIFGLSQPLGSGLIFGFIFGDISKSITLGAYLQLLYLATLPIGRHIPPDGELGGITGLAIHVLYPDLPLSIPLFFAILTSLFSSYTDILFRQFNNLLYRKGVAAASQERVGAAIRFHLLGLPVAFLRGFATVLLMLIIVGQINLNSIIWPDAVTVVPIAIGFASGLILFFKLRHIIYLLGGVMLGWIFQFLAG